MQYIKRKIEDTIRELEGEYPVITLTGPRQSGKTTLAKHLYPEYNYVNLEEPSYCKLALENPRAFLERFKTPLIIDEIQRAPELLRAIQVDVDASGHKAKQYIITGSQAIHLKGSVAESLAGRTIIFNVLPLSLEEIPENIDRDKLLLKGCLPRLWEINSKNFYVYYQSYLSTYIQKDVKQIALIEDERKFYDFLRVLAGRTGNLLNISSLAGELGVARATLDRWINILLSSYIIYTLYPWMPQSSSSFVKTPKIYFFDTGLLCSLLGISTEEQLYRDPLRGAIFENYMVMEALKQRSNRLLPDNLRFYRDKRGLEVDLIIYDGRTLNAFEIKSSKDFDKEQLSNITKFSKLYDKYLNKNAVSGLLYAGSGIFEYDGFKVLGLDSTSGVFC